MQRSFLILFAGCTELTSNLENDYPARLKSIVVGFSQKYVGVFTKTHTVGRIACAERQHQRQRHLFRLTKSCTVIARRKYAYIMSCEHVTGAS